MLTAVDVTRRRLPFWCALIDVWLAASDWSLSVEATRLLGDGLFVAGAVSLTIALMTVAGRAVDTYGLVLAPASPVSSLDRAHADCPRCGRPGRRAGASGTMANFFAGLFITLAGQIRVGDYIKLDSGQEGYVVDFSWRSTRLRMLSNNLVLVRTPSSRRRSSSTISCRQRISRFP